MHAILIEKRAAIAAVCERHRVSRLDVFGSAARGGDFDPAKSDVDLLVQFAPGITPDLAAFRNVKEDLESVLERDIDLVGREVIDRSRNYIRRRHILQEAIPLYVA